MSVGWLHFLADYYFSLTSTRACEYASSTRRYTCIYIHTYTHESARYASSGYFLPFCPRYYITFSEQQGVRSVSLHINEKICDFPPSSSSSRCRRRRRRTCEKRKSWKKKRVISHRCWILHLVSRPRLSLWIRFLLLLCATSAVIMTP